MHAYVSGIWALSGFLRVLRVRVRAIVVLDRTEPGPGVHMEQGRQQMSKVQQSIHRASLPGFGPLGGLRSSGMGLSYALRLVSKWRRGSVRLRWTLANLENLRPVPIQFGNKYQYASRSIALASLSYITVHGTQTDVQRTSIPFFQILYYAVVSSQRFLRHKVFLLCHPSYEPGGCTQPYATSPLGDLFATDCELRLQTSRGVFGGFFFLACA